MQRIGVLRNWPMLPLLRIYDWGLRVSKSNMQAVMRSLRLLFIAWEVKIAPLTATFRAVSKAQSFLHLKVGTSIPSSGFDDMRKQFTVRPNTVIRNSTTRHLNVVASILSSGFNDMGKQFTVRLSSVIRNATIRNTFCSPWQGHNPLFTCLYYHPLSHASKPYQEDM